MQGPPAMLVFALAAAGAASAVAAAAGDLADHFKVCSRSDPQLGQCIVDSLNGAREQLAEGIPELGLPLLDPMWVENVTLEEGQEDISLKLTLRNISLTGLKNFVATQARVDFAKPYLEIETQIPVFNLSGLYSFGGRVIGFPINGKGDFEYHMWNMNITHRMDLREEQRGGRTHWQVTQYLFDVDIGGMKVAFNDLFRGNRRLGIYANDFLNRNWRIAYAVYRPLVIKSWGIPFQNITNSLFHEFPVDELFST